MSAAATLRGPGEIEIVSPELALVDPAIASRARERLVDPDDTLTRLEHQIWRSRLASLGTVAAVDGPRGRSRRVRPPRSGKMSRTLVSAGAIAAALMTAVLLGLNVDLRSNPAGADSVRSEEPTSDGPAAEREAPESTPTVAKKPRAAPTRRRPPSRTAAPGPRRFAWAPVADASGYHVEFFRGAVRIFSRSTTGPHVALPKAWTFQGREYRLASGEYRWYVWPVVSGRRQSEATVQARLVVP